MPAVNEPVEGYVLTECLRIAHDPGEDPVRRRKAQAWADRLMESTGSNWGNDGKTVAESRGIEIDPKAPGGQKIESPSGHGSSKNEEAQARATAAYDGTPLSSEVDRRYRTER